MNDYLAPIVTAEEILAIHRYNPEEIPFVKDLVLGAQALLHNAGAWKPSNKMTKVAVELIVGYWLENRDSMNFEYRAVENLPIAVQGVIYSLQYAPEEVTADDPKNKNS